MNMQLRTVVSEELADNQLQGLYLKKSQEALTLLRGKVEKRILSIPVSFDYMDIKMKSINSDVKSSNSSEFFIMGFHIFVYLKGKVLKKEEPIADRIFKMKMFIKN